MGGEPEGAVSSGTNGEGHARWEWGRERGTQREGKQRRRGGTMERGCRDGWTHTEKENKELSWVAMEKTHRRKSSIGDESEVRLMNRKHQDEALDEMNTVVSSDFADDAQIENNCSQS
jgi:hypothetical protein